MCECTPTGSGYKLFNRAVWDLEISGRTGGCLPPALASGAQRGHGSVCPSTATPSVKVEMWLSVSRHASFPDVYVDEWFLEIDAVKSSLFTHPAKTSARDSVFFLPPSPVIISKCGTPWLTLRGGCPKS